MPDTLERIRGGLVAARSAYAAALDGSGRLPFLQFQLRVDRRRGIVATAADDRDWTDGSIDDTDRLGRLFLGLFIGPNRHLEVQQVIRFLAQTAQPDLALVADETLAAQFVNLMVVEPYNRPGREETILLAVAVALAKGLATTDVHELLPGLLTDSDPLERSAPGEEDWTAFEARLLAEAVQGAGARGSESARAAYLREYVVPAVERYLFAR